MERSTRCRSTCPGRVYLVVIVLLVLLGLVLAFDELVLPQFADDLMEQQRAVYAAEARLEQVMIERETEAVRRIGETAASVADSEVPGIDSIPPELAAKGNLVVWAVRPYGHILYSWSRQGADNRVPPETYITDDGHVAEVLTADGDDAAYVGGARLLLVVRPERVDSQEYTYGLSGNGPRLFTAHRYRLQSWLVDLEQQQVLGRHEIACQDKYPSFTQVRVDRDGRHDKVKHYAAKTRAALFEWMRAAYVDDPSASTDDAPQ